MRVLLWAAFYLFQLHAQAGLHPSTIYGDDDRRPVDASAPARIQRQADSVAALVLMSDLKPSGDGEFLAASSSLGSAFGLCPGTRFFDLPTLSDCTGFLISDRLMATAGHCLDETVHCANMAWVFDYRIDHIHWDGQVLHLKAKDTYRCKKVVAYSNTEKLDYAVIELDRRVVGRKPLPLALKPAMKAGDSIYGLGFPSGLPLTWDADGRVRRQRGLKIEGQIDTFEYNSGSPIFSGRSHQVIGILLEGDEDYEYNHKLGCSLPKQCDEKLCEGETFISTVILQPFLRASGL